MSKVFVPAALSVVAAIVIAAVIVHVWPASSPVPTYSVDPASVALTASDVAPGFTLFATGNAGPTQQTAFPLPYQKQYLGGVYRDFRAASVLSSAGQKEISDWDTKYGVIGPEIMGTFVTDHSGILEILDIERSLRTTDAAWHEYHCCHAVGEEQSYDDYHTFTIQHLGDEADGWSGIQKAPQGEAISPNIPTSDAFQELGFVVHWLHGPIVSRLTIQGPHNITLDDALRLAHIIDAHITQVLQQNKKAGSHASNILFATQVADRPSAFLAPLYAADRRINDWLRRS